MPGIRMEESKLLDESIDDIITPCYFGIPLLITEIQCEPINVNKLGILHRYYAIRIVVDKG